jgi:hypothetical protein
LACQCALNTRAPSGPFNHAALDRLGLGAFTLIASTLGITPSCFVGDILDLGAAFDTFNEFVGHALRHLYATLVLDPIRGSASNFDPRFPAKRLEQQPDWRIPQNMIGVRS